jgi:hypothetical protein
MYTVGLSCPVCCSAQFRTVSPIALTTDLKSQVRHHDWWVVEGQFQVGWGSTTVIANSLSGIFRPLTGCVQLSVFFCRKLASMKRPRAWC